MPVPPSSPPTPLRPVHVLYGGAHLFEADAHERLAAHARRAMETWGADDAVFAGVVGPRERPIAPNLATALASRVRAKLASAPVEAVCIDFEDGFGPRPDAEEDACAVRAAEQLARMPREAGPVVGIRIKALSGLTEDRAARTLELFLTTLARAATDAPALRPGFSVTLPKVSTTREVTALVERLARLESSLGLAPARVAIELMVETPRALLDETGRVALPSLVAAAGGRCAAVHLGAYDLTASLGVAGSFQRLDHPACDAARMLMQIALAGSGVAIVDGVTNTLPVARHRASGVRGAPPLTAVELAENARAVHDAWALHAAATTRALQLGIYEGWDVHPAQLPARYGALFAFFLGERDAIAERLRAFVANATRATRVGAVFDDAATGQGLVTFFLRGVACGAFAEADLDATGLSLPELRATATALARGTLVGR